MNFYVVPYIEHGNLNADNYSWCNDALKYMAHSSYADPLYKNYQIENMKLEEMLHFTFIADQNHKPEHCAGCQILSQNVIRIFSRYFVFPEYRHTGKHLLDKNDKFLDLKYWLERLDKWPLIIWSRERGPGFFKRISRKNSLFNSWNIYHKDIELRYKNNWQSIFYKGDITYLQEVDRNALTES